MEPDLRHVAAAAHVGAPLGPGLWISQQTAHPFASALGFEKVQEEVPRWPDELAAVWLTADDYLGPVTKAAEGEPLDPSTVLSGLLWMYTCEDMVTALAALNHVVDDPDAIALLIQRVRPQLTPEVAAALDVALAVEGNEKRHLITRPTLLRAMRLAAQFCPANEAARSAHHEEIGAGGDLWDPLLAGMVLSHVVASGMGSRSSTLVVGREDQRLAGLPEGLALEMLRSSASVRSENAANLIGRTRLFYEAYGPRVERHPARRSANELVEEALGMSLDDCLFLGFACLAHSMSIDPFSNVMRFTPIAPGVDVTEEAWIQFLDLFAQTRAEFHTAASEFREDWQMRSIQSRPLLRLGDEVVVLDERFLVERFTRGLYWLVHDFEKLHHGDSARQQWTMAHGEMHELLVEDYLRQFAPPLIGQGISFFGEEELGAAFPGKKADAGIDYGDSVLIADAQGGQLSVPAREDGDLKALKRDLERMVLEKAVQLSDTADHLLLDPQPKNSPISRPAKRVYPVVVSGGSFPSSPVTTRYIDDEVEKRGLFTDHRVERLSVLDLRDLEHAEGVRLRDSSTLAEIISVWKEGPYADFSLSDWLLLRDREAGSPPLRPGALDRALEESFKKIMSRVRDEA